MQHHARGVEYAVENRRVRSSEKRRSSFDVAAVVAEHHGMKKRRARDSVRVIQGSSSSHSSPHSLVSIPVEPYSTSPWNSCFTEQGFDGVGQTSTSASQFSVHAVDSCVELGIDCHYEAETATEDCEDGRLVVEASGHRVDGDERSTTDPSCQARESIMSPLERIQMFRQQMSGNVVIPDTWSGEENLKDWAHFGTVEDALRPLGLMMATASLANDSLSKQRSTSSRLPGPASVSPVVLSQLR